MRKHHVYVLLTFLWQTTTTYSIDGTLLQTHMHSMAQHI